MVRATSPLSKSTSLPPKTSVISSFLRRKKPHNLDRDPPPPTPPKDNAVHSRTSPPKDLHTSSLFASGSQPPRSISAFANNIVPSSSHANLLINAQEIPDQIHRNSLSDFVHVSNFPPAEEFEHDTVVLEPYLEPSSVQDEIRVPRHSQRKWRQEPSVHLSPAEKAQKRIDAQRKRQGEEAAAMREEADRQAQLKLIRKELQLQEQEEDERRRAQAMEEAKRVAAQRARKAKKQQEEDERMTRELQERKQLEHERRMEETRKLEKWRREQAKMNAEEARRKKVAEMAAEEDRKSKIQQVEAKFKKGGAESLKAGWVTVQTNETLTWKRRYFVLNGDTMVFHRSPKVSLDVISHSQTLMIY
jgi:hypothetical protein